MFLFDKKWINPNHISCTYISASDTVGYDVNVQVGPTLLKERFSTKDCAEHRLETILKIINYDRNITNSNSIKS